MVPIEHHIHSTYSLPLVLLSIAVAIFSAYVSLDISSRLKYAERVSRIRCVISGAISLGLGIWAMHFIGMLAFHLEADVSYHIGIVIASILPAVISSGFAFYIVSLRSVRPRDLLISAVFISIGIVSMHYVGMEAMQMNAVITYDPVMWLLSAVVAFIASLVGLYLLFSLPDVSRFHWRKLVSSLLIGLAVSGMHYIGMSAAVFTPLAIESDFSGFSMNSTLLAYWIAGSVMTLFLLMLISVRNEKQLEMQSKESETKFQSVIESANDAIIVADAERRIVQWNQGAERLFGYRVEDVLGHSITLIMPERFQSAQAGC